MIDPSILVSEAIGVWSPQPRLSQRETYPGFLGSQCRAHSGHYPMVSHNGELKHGPDGGEKQRERQREAKGS